jgi:hypothetical protein
MKVDAVEIYHVAMPLITPWTTAYGSDSVIESVLVKMTSGDTFAWGEACPLAAPTSVLSLPSPRLLRIDAKRTRPMWTTRPRAVRHAHQVDRIQRRQRAFERSGGGRNMIRCLCLRNRFFFGPRCGLTRGGRARGGAGAVRANAAASLRNSGR